MDEIVARLAAANGGLVLRSDLLGAGLDDCEVRRVVRGLTRLRDGAYTCEAPAGPEARHLLTARAVLASARRQYAASHYTAALAWGLPTWGPVAGEVQVRAVGELGASGSGSRRGVRYFTPAVRVHDVVVRAGLEVVDASQTVLDCARTLPLDQAVAVADAALHTGIANPWQMQTYAETLAAGSARGLSAIARVVGLLDPRSESPGETRLRLIAQRRGYHVTSQFVVKVGSHDYRADLRVEGARVLLEFDGREKYSLRGDIEQAHWEEKLRRDALTAQGWEVARFVWSELADETLIGAKIRRAVQLAERYNWRIVRLLAYVRQFLNNPPVLGTSCSSCGRTSACAPC